MADIRGSYDDLFTAVPTALAVQLDDGDADLDLAAPVARFWPEFAAAGKEQVLVRHLLAHTAGLPDWNGPIEELYDWPSATARLAGQEPLWEPGSAAGSHSLTQGFLVGEVVRRRRTLPRHRRPGPGREQHGLASGAGPRGERLRQRPLGRPRAVGAGLRRSSGRGAVAVAGGR
ncbi:serine hydrolase domain-containing protein [Modestobacter sp. I12A-02662]|uniref:serine hydrolase domain-containing protein n=1 Tax=Modestobacter sp. I12A-02662 TaxID=1730496 RepID=UPI0034DEEE98